MGIDNPNFSGYKSVGGGPRDVTYEEFKGIGRYWNLLARKLGRAKPAGITRSFLIFLPSFVSLLALPSLKRRSTVRSDSSFSPAPRCSSVRIHLSLFRGFTRVYPAKPDRWLSLEARKCSGETNEDGRRAEMTRNH